ncbi:hypothetical protein M2163_000869 [Streptomyces sp. SAI-135]|jgi:hypothetical protein|uniref:hypothetical protein n=1 Tax=unclassified Streptomyces TaxID=2593676 RepID=UPI0024748503|nr:MULTISPECIES: hypothetical protein [unclassified Streptomyces]MDH6522621.1 hypothetical protein [Streptomyces sp. SAI-090]MDH6554244.1 hypothetical protein [Streptomyces sp. SAI-041]MDH6573504.1 hypothetical protein [Streptomyces sp. SAI-117]MDH6581758.1 hypothetical protein [Streptomyces sp. SAI-133]MDH6613761.1 hypothetical protein [Streptomyces sp. SAI-135]
MSQSWIISASVMPGAMPLARMPSGRRPPATVAATRYTYDHDASGNQVATIQAGTVTNRTQWGPNAPLPILATE